MSTRKRASHCRQRIAELLADIERRTQAAQGLAPLVRGSFYRFRRRCGKKNCRCARGELHAGQAFSVRKDGRSRTVPLAGVDRDKLVKAVEVYRELRKARANMVRGFKELLTQVDRMEQLREVGADRFKRRKRRSSS